MATVSTVATSRTASSRSGGNEHEWWSVDDPDEDRTWLFDVTFLASSWSCLYGCGCNGVLDAPAPELGQGCCSYGAHLSGPEDVARVEAAAESLTAEQWQHRRRAAKRGPLKRRGGVTMTRLVDDACIFLNRPGFAAGAGCALHRAALDRGISPVTLKPDVCWQLPLRREDVTDEATGHVTSTVTQWDRRHWGPAGEDFAWWCTDAPDAFSGRSPVYVSLAEELVALVGAEPYRLLAAYLDGRRARSQLLAHPAVRDRTR